jgi:hypothetical protein
MPIPVVDTGISRGNFMATCLLATIVRRRRIVQNLCLYDASSDESGAPMTTDLAKAAAPWIIGSVTR